MKSRHILLIIVSLIYQKVSSQTTPAGTAVVQTE